SGEIAAGAHVHTHNVRSALRGSLSDLSFEAVAKPQAAASRNGEPRVTFDGFRRPDGRAATRNEIWIVNTVGCVNHASERIAAAANRDLAAAPAGSTSVEGVDAVPHPFGGAQL